MNLLGKSQTACFQVATDVVVSPQVVAVTRKQQLVEQLRQQKGASRNELVRQEKLLQKMQVRILTMFAAIHCAESWPFLDPAYTWRFPAEVQIEQTHLGL